MLYIIAILLTFSAQEGLDMHSSTRDTATRYFITWRLRVGAYLYPRPLNLLE